MKHHFATLDLFLCFSSVIKKNEMSILFTSFWHENVIFLLEAPKIYGIFCFPSCCNQLIDNAQIPSTLTWQGVSHQFQQKSCERLHGQDVCACSWAHSLHMGREYPAGPAGLFHCSHSYCLTMNCILLCDAPNKLEDKCVQWHRRFHTLHLDVEQLKKLMSCICSALAHWK